VRPCNIFIEREHGGFKHQITFARIEQSKNETYFIRLRGFVLGRWCSLGWDDKHYIAGPIFFDGPIAENGERLSQEIGHVWTDSNQDGICYNGVFYISPFPLAMQIRRSENTMSLWGLSCRIDNQ